MNGYFCELGCLGWGLGWYLDVATLAASRRVRNVEVAVEAHPQVTPLGADDPPQTFHVFRKVLGIVRRLDGSCVSVDDATTAWRSKVNTHRQVNDRQSVKSLVFNSPLNTALNSPLNTALNSALNKAPNSPLNKTLRSPLTVP